MENDRQNNMECVILIDVSARNAHDDDKFSFASLQHECVGIVHLLSLILYAYKVPKHKHKTIPFTINILHEIEYSGG